MKNFFLLLFCFMCVFEYLFAKSQFDFLRTSFVPMTCSQNLYTQYHKLNLSNSDNYECYDYRDDKGRCFFDDILSDFSLTYRYIQNRNNSGVASSLWGSNELFFQGSEVPERSNNALIAEYFGMAPDTNMIIEMNPLLKNNVLDLQLALNRGKAWFQINIPLMWSKWLPKREGVQFECRGLIGRNNLDGGSFELEYKPENLMITANEIGSIFINGYKLANTVINNLPGCVWFDNNESVSIDNSIIGRLDADESLPVVSLQNARIEVVDNLTTRTNLLADGGALCYIENYNEVLDLGIIPVGLYGKVATDVNTEKVGTINIGVNVENVFPININHIDFALDKGYAFGKFAGRENNNFNFNAATKFNVADIPMMIGYDFYKNSNSHVGGYVKLVLPTGTKIDKDFLQYVLTPVIGNGHHFELGFGVSSHYDFVSCDQYLYSIFIDGYLNKLFGTPQVRVFDLPKQSMSRYSLAFPVSGGSMRGYTVSGDKMISIGDVNLYQGNVDAWRGEFILNFMCTYSFFEFSIGYAFAGQSEELIDGDYKINNQMQNQYGIVGQAAQNLIGIGMVYPSSADNQNAYFNNNIKYIPSTLTTPPLGDIQVNFFNLGDSNQISEILEGESSAYSYGKTVSAGSSSLAAVCEFENNQSGLMAGQVLNRIFSTFDYVWRDNCYQPEIGIVGSIGFSPKSKLTADYWDLGARCGFIF